VTDVATDVAIDLIRERREEIQREIRRLTNLVLGLDMALEILEGGNTEAAFKALSAAPTAAGKPAAKTDKPLTPAPWPKTLYDVPERHLRDLHALGLSDNKITKELQRQGYSCNQANTSRKLRAMGLRANGRRVPPGRDRTASTVSTPSPESASPQRKRKTADERKEEVFVFLEQGKTVEEIAAATGLKESSVKLYCSILKARTKELPICAATPSAAEVSEEDEGDERLFHDQPAEAESTAGEDDIDAQIRKLHALKLTDQQMANRTGRSKATICQRRNRMGLPSNGQKGRPPGALRSGKPTEEGEYPIIGGTQENPVYGSMRMKVIEEKIVDGHKVKVLPPGYAQGAEPAKNVSVSS
jgi:hypothetical protein